MRLLSFLIVLTVVAGGAVECGRGALTEQQRYGGDLYVRMCAVCHGPSGEGYKADEATALGHPEFLASVSNDFLRTAIAHGRTNTVMSAWSGARGGPLGDSDIDAIIAYLHAWRARPPAALDDRPVRGDAKRGAAIYEKECARCHGPRGLGGPNVHLGNVELQRTASDGFLRYAILKGRPGTAMPAFEASLGGASVEDVLAHIRTFRPSVIAKPAQKPARPPPLPLGPVPLNPNGPAPVGFTQHPEATSVELVKSALDRHARLALLDARTPSDYSNEHIAGAVSVPFYDPSPYLAALPKDTWLVCYCSCPSAESGMLAAELIKNGFKKVTVLKEGLRVWKAKKYPTREGDKP